MQNIPKSERSGLFADEGFRGALYQLDEPVLDVGSLLKALIKPYAATILKTPDSTPEWIKQDGNIAAMRFGDELEIQAQQFVLTSGEGTGELLESLQLTKPKMQKRPLQMLLCKSKDPANPLPQIYAHSLGSGSKPIATISSHPDKTGNIVWYLGGNIAEEGVGKDPAKLVEEARALLKQILPWFTLPELEWTTHNVNRAEPKQSGFARPDSAYVSSHNNLHIAWPTKLALSPDLADKVIEALAKQNVQKTAHPEQHILPLAQLAEPLWDRAFNK